MCLGINEFLEIVKSIGIIIASGVAMWGINSWRREAKWKRKYELAEEVLANFYEAHDAIRNIRKPWSNGYEGSSRLKDENETPEQTKIFNQAFIVRERFEINKKTFERLRTLKFRFIALYGKKYEEYFDKFPQTVNQIFVASDQIAMIKLGHYDYNPSEKRDIMRECNKTLYGPIKIGGDNNDEIENDLYSSIKNIENKCRSIIGKRN